MKTLQSEDVVGMNRTQIRVRLGRPVRTFGGLGTLVIIGDGHWAFRVRLLCQGDGCKKTRVSYLRPGPGGPDHYVVNWRGRYLADLRDESYACKEHR